MLLLAAALAPGAGCGTVDVGPPTGPPMGCNASPVFFVEHAWPEYLDLMGCGASDCHDSDTGHGYFRLRSVAGSASFDPHQPTSQWPDAWRENLAAASRLLDCADPDASLLLAVPEGRGQPHPPGDVVKKCPPSAGACDPHATAETLFRDWAAAR
jgi:hypothetical protein